MNEEDTGMGAAVSLLVIAIGAILDFAVTVQNDHGFNLNRIGLILIVIGIIGLIVSAVYWFGSGGSGTYHRRTVRRTTHRGGSYDGQGIAGGSTPSTYIDETQQRF